MATPKSAARRKPKATAKANATTNAQLAGPSPSTRSLSDVLEAARVAVTGGELARALELLLAAWRAFPAAAIADAIDAVGARTTASVTPPSGTTAKARNDAWDRAARAGDPVMLGVLAATLTETKGSADTLARIELLVQHRDPRIAARIVGLVEKPAYNASVSRTRPFWKRVFELLAELGDPRIVVRQRAFEAGWTASAELNDAERPELARRLARVAPALEAAYGDGPPPLSPEDDARCAAIVAALAASATAPGARTEAELLAEIYAAPDDDQARMVYADWLQERGEPRGELIALQLARTGGERPSKARRDRESQLLAEHATRWIGPLAKQVTKKSLVFERGFLAACAFNQQFDAPEKGHRFAFGLGIDTSAEWATVREVAGGAPSSDACRLGALRVLRDLTNAHIEHLTTLTRPLDVEELGWKGPYVRYDEDPADTWRRWTDMFTRIRVLPKLRRLGLEFAPGSDVPPADVRFLRVAPGSALRELCVTTSPVNARAWLALIEPTRVQCLEIHQPYWDWRLCFARDAAGTLARLTVVAPRSRAPAAEQLGRLVVEGLAGLPPQQLTSARVVVAPATWPLVEAHLRADLDACFARQTRLASPAAFERA